MSYRDAFRPCSRDSSGDLVVRMVADVTETRIVIPSLEIQVFTVLSLFEFKL